MSDRPKVGIGVVVRRNGKLLMGLRNGKHAGGQWCCPGGHLESGESWEDCALREVAEECGVKISRPVFGCVTNDVFPDGRHYVSLFMVADYISGEAQELEPDKLTKWQWVGWNELPQPALVSYDNAKAQGFDPFTFDIKKAAA